MSQLDRWGTDKAYRSEAVLLEGIESERASEGSLEEGIGYRA